MHPESGLQESVVQVSSSSQLGGAPPTHWPALHVSPVVQPLPSSQGTAFVTWTQPILGSQESSVHGFASSQSSDPVGPQTPASQTSPVVQTSPSKQSSALFSLTQPVSELQESSVQTLPSLQFSSPAPTHCSSAQTSFGVQASPSSHGWLFVA
jgi:hypothetical protein